MHFQSAFLFFFLCCIAFVSWGQQQYGGFLITALFSLISLSIYIHSYKTELLAGVSDGISREIKNYNDERNATGGSLMDFLQKNVSNLVCVIIVC